MCGRGRSPPGDVSARSRRAWCSTRPLRSICSANWRSSSDCGGAGGVSCDRRLVRCRCPVPERGGCCVRRSRRRPRLLLLLWVPLPSDLVPSCRPFYAVRETRSASRSRQARVVLSGRKQTTPPVRRGDGHLGTTTKAGRLRRGASPGRRSSVSRLCSRTIGNNVRPVLSTRRSSWSLRPLLFTNLQHLTVLSMRGVGGPLPGLFPNLHPTVDVHHLAVLLPFAVRSHLGRARTIRPASALQEVR